MAERRKDATGSREAVRRLSDDVLAIAQVARRQPITEDAHERLIDAGLTLRRLAR